jgi:hypothetical protein
MMASYFWIPALFERSYVVGLNTVNPLDHFASVSDLLIPSWGTEFSSQSIGANKMSFQIGILPIIWMILAVILAFREKRRIYLLYAGVIALVLGIGYFLMLASSQWIWAHMPVISYIQYPWRLLSLGILAVAIASAYVSSRISRWLGFFLVVISVLSVYSYARPAMYERREDAYYQARSNFMDGTSSMGNSFSTIWTGWKNEKSTEHVSVLEGEASIVIHEQKPLQTKLTVHATGPVRIRIHTIYFPGWRVYDGRTILPIAYEKEGVLDVSLADGEHELLIIFEETPIRMTGNMLSFIGLLWFFGWAILTSIYAYSHTYGLSFRWAQSERHRSLHKRAHKRIK